MKPDDVPAELIAILDAAAGKAHSHAGSVVTCLAQILTVHERQVREQIAAEIERYADVHGDGSPWDGGMGRAAEIVRGEPC